MSKAKNPKKPPSARALERRAIKEKYQDVTLIGIEGLVENRLDDPVKLKELNRELRKYYTDARAIALKSIKRIQESEMPFTDEPPEFMKTSELTDEQLYRAVADINLFLKSPTRTLEKRRDAYQELLKSLHEKGMTYLKIEDLKYWDRYRKWLRASNLLGKPYAAGDILGDIFAESVKMGKPDSETWSSLYEKVKAMQGSKPRNRRRRRRR